MASNNTKGRCPICMDEIAAVQSLSTTLCGHVFCTACLEQSLLHKNECPACRTNQAKHSKTLKGKPIKLFIDLTGVRQTFEPHTIQAHLQEEVDEKERELRKVTAERDSAVTERDDFKRRHKAVSDEKECLESKIRNIERDNASLKKIAKDEGHKNERLIASRDKFEREIMAKSKEKEEELVKRERQCERMEEKANEKDKAIHSQHQEIRKLNAKLEKADQDLRAALAKIEKLEKAKSANPEPSRTTTRRPSPPSIFADEPTEDVLGIFDVRDNGQTASKQEVEPQEDDAVVVLDSDENEEVEDDDDDDLFGGVIVPGMGAFRKSVKVPTAKPAKNLPQIPRQPLQPVNNLNAQPAHHPTVPAKRPLSHANIVSKPAKKAATGGKTMSVAQEQRGFMSNWMKNGN